MRKLLFTILLAHVLLAHTGQTFDGQWQVDDGADDRSSDTGPFFHGLVLTTTRDGEIMERLEGISGGERIETLLRYPSRGKQGRGLVNGHAALMRRDKKGDSLELVWQDPEDRSTAYTVRRVFVLDANRKKLTIRVFVNAGSAPAQVIVLRRVETH